MPVGADTQTNKTRYSTQRTHTVWWTKKICVCHSAACAMLILWTKLYGNTKEVMINSNVGERYRNLPRIDVAGDVS